MQMNLRSVIENLSSFSSEATVFAERVDGAFNGESEVQLVEMTDEELKQPVVKVAKEKAPGKEYFLEVFIIQEVLDGWSSNHGGQTPPIDVALEGVIYYAKYDAYPDTFLG
jgi:hypothetical protein